jgi:TPR repeat protein
MYLAGEGLPRDATEAARWLGKAADQNVTAAYDRLGAMYADGLGLPQDFQAAADWFHRAAAEGDANGLYHLGTLHLGGLGMPSDVPGALRWYIKAAASGSGVACLQLGILRATGQQVRQNYRAAARWYAQAAIHGVEEGRYNLAFLHFRGLGVRQDSAHARQLLEQATAGGSVQAAWALYRQYAAEGASWSCSNRAPRTGMPNPRQHSRSCICRASTWRRTRDGRCGGLRARRSMATRSHRPGSATSCSRAAPRPAIARPPSPGTNEPRFKDMRGRSRR